MLSNERNVNELLAVLPQNISDGVLFIDTGGVIRHCNQAAEHILGIARDDIINQPMPPTWNFRNFDWNRAIDQRLDDPYVTPLGETTFEQTVTLANRLINVRLSSVYDADEQLLGTLIILPNSRFDQAFVAAITHMQTLLTSIQGYTDLMAMGALGDISDKQQHTLRKMQQYERHFGTFLDDMLYMAQIDTNQERLIVEEVDLLNDMKSLVAYLRRLTRYRDKTVMVTVNIANEATLIFADRRKLFRVLGSLIDNAFSTIQIEGTVHINARRDSKRPEVIITVHSDGPATPIYELPWRGFHLEEDNITDTSTSTGLGLMLAMAVIAMHGGRMWQNDGQTFNIALPLGI